MTVTHSLCAIPIVAPVLEPGQLDHSRPARQLRDDPSDSQGVWGSIHNFRLPSV